MVYLPYEDAFSVGEITGIMMKLLFNGNLIEDPIPWSAADRAFQYGDGFFETMLFSNGKVPLLSYHLSRIKRAAEIFHLTLQESEFRYLEENIETLIQLNELEDQLIRAKLMIWRRSTGQRGYRTSETHANWVLMVFPHEPAVFRSGLRIGISNSTTIAPHPWSGVKTINALPYVLAGMECENTDYDDLILTTPSGKLAECIESNIFWKQDGIWHTPSLNSGCVAGTMRAYLLENTGPFGQTPVEILADSSTVTPEQAFTCNATSLVSIGEWKGVPLSENPEFFQEWLTKLAF